MNAPAGFLEFFILEASEYVEQLDGLLNAAGSSAPDIAAFQRTARALRGTATIRRAGGVARACRPRSPRWRAAVGRRAPRRTRRRGR